MLLTGTKYWIPVKDGYHPAAELYRKHYSCRDPKVDFERYGFSGNGESLVLISENGDALWCWRKVNGEGINCSIFHNESPIQSSFLILEAEELAWERWPNERLYTYVNSRKIRSTNPGYCYLKAGWRKCGLTKGGLVILEKFPIPSERGEKK